MAGPIPPLRILSFDLEDWFHLLEVKELEDPATWPSYPSRVEAATDRLLALLEAKGWKATFFVLGWVAEHHKALLKRIVAGGHDLGSHSSNHTLVHRQSPSAFRDELRRSLGQIQDAVGVRVQSFRAPGFSITNDCLWAFEILVQEGIRVDSSVFQGNRAHGGLLRKVPAKPFNWQTPSGTLLELPVNTRGSGSLRVPAAGGGYFRLMPYFLTRALCIHSPYQITYFHPRDFDREQPKLGNLPWHRRFRSYYGIAGAFEKLERLMEDFDWVTISHALTLLETCEMECIPSETGV